MRPDAALFGYMVAMLAALVGLWLANSFRRRRFLSGPAEDRVFRCSRCGCVYTDDPDVDLSPCPQCARMNEKLDFRA